MTQVQKMTQAIEGIADLDQKTPGEIAEALVSSGATIQPVRMGQVMWAYLDREIRSCTVEMVLCLGGATHEECIFGVATEHGVRCQYKVKDIGVAVFEGEAEAREALAQFVKTADN